MVIQSAMAPLPKAVTQPKAKPGPASVASSAASNRHREPLAPPTAKPILAQQGS